MFIRLVNKIFKKTPYAIIKKKYGPTADMIECDPAFPAIYEKCKPYTMTSVERMYTLYKSIEYIIQQNIPGNLVECGVWKGGSSMLIAHTLLHFGDTSRIIYLYDTFEGMTEPEPSDFLVGQPKQTAIHRWMREQKANYNTWDYASLEEVQKNLYSTGYPSDKLLFVKGKVEDTIPNTIPDRISLLRLDTDWEQSTKHELQHLFPLLEKNGILIIDDYGHWAGAKKAVDEYMTLHPHFLSRIDSTGRLCVKR